ncbi:replication-relaxation family protein [Streptomyces violascens]|uniref:replication-relaxation family protein n=1 Tax=Streptomyces violascens TaxID=67381 RepID=UPI003667B792
MQTTLVDRPVRPPTREQLLKYLFQHRAATTAQLQAMVSPSLHPETLRQNLRRLRAEQLAQSVVRAHHQSVWSLTARGQQAVLSWPQFRGRRAYRTGPLGLRSAHTLTVTRTAVAFLEDARVRADERSPLDWEPEVAHPVRDGAADGERVLIADALLRYTRTGSDRALLRAFVEVDRATESAERLAAKLITYARFHAAPPTPAGRRRGGGAGALMAPWQRSYPVFPRVLFVLTGAGPRALAQRIADLQAMVRQHPLVSQFAAAVPLGAAVLEEIEEHAASADVWLPLADGSGRCSWMSL